MKEKRKVFFLAIHIHFHTHTHRETHTYICTSTSPHYSTIYPITQLKQQTTTTATLWKREKRESKETVINKTK